MGQSHDDGSKVFVSIFNDDRCFSIHLTVYSDLTFVDICNAPVGHLGTNQRLWKCASVTRTHLNRVIHRVLVKKHLEKVINYLGLHSFLSAILFFNCACELILIFDFAFLTIKHEATINNSCIFNNYWRHRAKKILILFFLHARSCVYLIAD